MSSFLFVHLVGREEVLAAHADSHMELAYRLPGIDNRLENYLKALGEGRLVAGTIDHDHPPGERAVSVFFRPEELTLQTASRTLSKVLSSPAVRAGLAPHQDLPVRMEQDSKPFSTLAELSDERLAREALVRRFGMVFKEETGLETAGKKG